MKISEVIKMLEDLRKEEDCNAEVLGISVNGTHITICYEDTDFGTRSHKADYKNCDLDQ